MKNASSPGSLGQRKSKKVLVPSQFSRSKRVSITYYWKVAVWFLCVLFLDLHSFSEGMGKLDIFVAFA